MKTQNSITMMLILSLVFCKTATCDNGSAGDEGSNSSTYILVKADAGIRIFTRWIPVDETRSGKEVKAEFIVNGTVDEVLSVLRDDKSFITWMNATKVYYRVKTVDDNQWFSYVQFATPWPLNNRDIVIRYEVENTRPGKILVRMTGEPSYLHTFDGVKRIRHMIGSWGITDLGNNTVMVEYTMFSNQKAEFPLWITDPIIQKSLVRTMTAFRGAVSK
jgi:hypothetical protein